MRGRVRTIAIPSWLDEVAPGAAQAARTISRANLSVAERERLARLTGDATEPAWREISGPARKGKAKLDGQTLWAAQHDIMVEAFRAADFQPIGGAEIERWKERFGKAGTAARKLAGDLREFGEDVQIVGMWRTYLNKHLDHAPVRMPNDPVAMSAAVEQLADFCDRAGIRYKREGPIPPVGQPGDCQALETTVMRHIAGTCKKHFGTYMAGTAAILANASLGRDDITPRRVRESMRGPRENLG
jgi:hypothetical protein